MVSLLPLLVACGDVAPADHVHDKEPVGAVVGTVTLSDDADPNGAFVVVAGRAAAVGTDGTYRLEEVAAGEQSAWADLDGYVRGEQVLVVPAGGEVTADFVLLAFDEPPLLAWASATPPQVAPGGSIALAASASDPEGLPLGWSWTVDDSAWTLAPGDGGAATLTAPDAYGAVATVTVLVSDGTASAEAALVVSTAANEGPLLASIIAQPPSTSRGGTIDLVASASDPDGDPLAWEWTVDGEGWSLQADDAASVVLQAPADPASTARATVRVVDAEGLEAVGSVVVSTRPNQPPQLASLSATPNPVWPADPVTVVASAQDPDDTLTYAWTVDDGAWQVAGTGATVTLTPPTAFGESTAVRVTVSDGRASVEGQIGVSTQRCGQDRADCNGDPVDGCEVDLASDVAHCGACPNACPVPEGGEAVCAASTCAFTCEPGRVADAGSCAVCGSDALLADGPLALWSFTDGVGTDGTGGGRTLLLPQGGRGDSGVDPADAGLRLGGAAAIHDFDTLVPPLSLSSWVRTPATESVRPLSTEEELIFDLAYYRLELTLEETTAARWSRGAGEARVETAVDLRDNRWHQLVVVLEPERLSLYVDGAPVGSVSHSVAAGETIGRLFLEPMVGLRDEVAVWDRALTAEEVAAHFLAVPCGAACASEAMPPGSRASCAPPLCADILATGLHQGDGTYWIDPSGTDAFEVACAMEDGGWTVFAHDQPEEVHNATTENPGAFVLPVVYEQSLARVEAAEAVAVEVRQHVSKRCRGSLIHDGQIFYAWWDTAGLAVQGAWPHAEECDLNDSYWRLSAGYVTDPAALPVHVLYDGDAGSASEEAYLQVGPYELR